MSASLVGSEMCIRDSVWTYPYEDLMGRLKRVAGASTSSLVACKLPRTACLLYTSDAADDM
eukprot:8350416-Alexandrium_andersonii.AAC.1